MKRRADWQSRLQSFLLERQAQPFSYGRFDCCLFVADAIESMTGVDIAQPLRGRYRTRQQAFEVIHAFTGRRTVHAIALRLFYDHGLPLWPAKRAQRGDAVLLDNDSLGLVDLNGRDAIACAETGLWRAPLSLARKAWHV